MFKAIVLIAMLGIVMLLFACHVAKQRRRDIDLMSDDEPEE